MMACRGWQRGQRGAALATRPRTLTLPRSQGLPVANVVLLRGCGSRIRVPDFQQLHGMRGVIVAPTKIIAGAPPRSPLAAALPLSWGPDPWPCPVASHPTAWPLARQHQIGGGRGTVACEWQVLGGVVRAVCRATGLALSFGMDEMVAPGATGAYDTDFSS